MARRTRTRTPKPVTHRKQADRREETRGRLLAAALDTLVDHGYAEFTTTEVCNRSGLSQGALFRYFPTKADLLSATIEHLFAELRSGYEVRFRELSPEQATVPNALRLLGAIFEDPRLLAAYELYTAARTDSTLRRSLVPIVRAHTEGIQQLALRLFARPGSSLPPARFVALAELVIFALQGLAVGDLALPRPDTKERLFQMAEELTAPKPRAPRLRIVENGQGDKP